MSNNIKKINFLPMKFSFLKLEKTLDIACAKFCDDCVNNAYEMNNDSVLDEKMKTCSCKITYDTNFPYFLLNVLIMVTRENRLIKYP